jgi:hypothetical protein
MRAGVERICGVVGDSLNGVTESLRTQNAIRQRDRRFIENCERE